MPAPPGVEAGRLRLEPHLPERADGRPSRAVDYFVGQSCSHMAAVSTQVSMARASAVKQAWSQATLARRAVIRHSVRLDAELQSRSAALSRYEQDVRDVGAVVPSQASTAARGACSHASRVFWQPRIQLRPGPKHAANFFARMVEHVLVQRRYEVTLGRADVERHSLVVAAWLAVTRETPMNAAAMAEVER